MGEEFLPQRNAAFKRVGETEDGGTLFHFDLFSSDATCQDGGLQHYKIRLYPYHELLSHPLDRITSYNVCYTKLLRLVSLG